MASLSSAQERRTCSSVRSVISEAAILAIFSLPCSATSRSSRSSSSSVQGRLWLLRSYQRSRHSFPERDCARGGGLGKGELKEWAMMGGTERRFEQWPVREDPAAHPGWGSRDSANTGHTRTLAGDPSKVLRALSTGLPPPAASEARVARAAASC